MVKLDDALLATMRTWRHDLHAHPETAFEEFRTSDFVAARLAEDGFEVHRGLGGTGVVGTLSVGAGPIVGLRADMDALHVTEKTGLAHASRHPGRMHACGHDGHTTMLLGAARHLAATRNFSGTLRVIFQPAEENEGGGRRMIEDGLFAQFPCDRIFGLHNWPAMPLGTFGVNGATMMAAFDTFEIEVHGRGCHGAMPETGIDPIVVGAEIVTALQTVVARRLSPLERAVVSVTQFHGGDTWNVVPDGVILRGTTRSMSPDVQDRIETAMREICEGVAAAHGARAELRYERRYPATINTPAEAAEAAAAARAVLGEAAVNADCAPSMAAEDFGFMLRERPGAYAFLGVGDADHRASLHNPLYDFNDAALALGASWWIALVERILPR
jgi:hippurate hydrolase